MMKTLPILILSTLCALVLCSPLHLGADELSPVPSESSQITFTTGAHGSLRETSQLFWDPDAQRLTRVHFALFDLLPEHGLDLFWQPSNEADLEHATDTHSQILWLKPGAAPYDSGQIRAMYSGAIVNGKPHGQGYFWTQSGAVYDGAWVDGKMAGQGQLQLADGQEFQGSFSDNRFHGTGRLIAPDGTQIAGQFIDDKPHGAATVFPVNQLACRTVWHYGVEQPYAREPVTGTNATAHILPVQQTNANDARVGVAVNMRLPEGFTPRDVMLYKSFDRGGVLQVVPGDDAFVQRWLGNDPLIVTGDYRNQETDFYDGYHRPTNFDLTFENTGNQPLTIVGGYLSVQQSTPSLNPAIEVFRDIDCGTPSITAFTFRNYGWTQPLNAYLDGAFISPTTGARVQNVSGNLPGDWPMTQVNFYQVLQQLGLNMDLLSSQDLQCNSDYGSCLEVAKVAGFFGPLRDAVYLDRASVHALFEGSLRYDWPDASGQMQQRVSPLSLAVKVAQFPWQIQTCAEGGESIEIYPNPFVLETSGAQYRRPFPMSANIAAGTISRWTFQVDAAMASRHQFQVILQLADGREIASRLVDLTYFKPADPWGGN